MCSIKKNNAFCLLATLLLSLPVIAQQKPDFISQNGLATEVSKTIFDPSGNNLIAYESHKGFIYDIRSGLEKAHFKCHEEISALIATDNSTFYVGFPSGRLEQRKLSNGEIVSAFQLNFGPITSIAVSNLTSNELLIGANILLLFNKTSQDVKELPFSHVSTIFNERDKSGYRIISLTASINSIKLNNDFVVINDVALYKQPRLKFFQTFHNTSEAAFQTMNFGFSNNLIIQSKNGKLKFHDLTKNEIVLKESSYYLQEFFTSAAICDTFNLALLSTNEGSIYIYDLTKNKFNKHIKSPHLSKINDISVSEDGLFFVTSSDDYTLLLWDSKTLEPIRRIYSKSFSLTGIACTESSKRIITSNSAGIVTELDLKSLNILVGSKEISPRSISDFDLMAGDSTLLYSCPTTSSLYNLWNGKSESTISIYNLKSGESKIISKKSANKLIDYSAEADYLNLGKNIVDLEGKNKIKLKKGEKKRRAASLMSPDKTKIITISRVPQFTKPLSENPPNLLTCYKLIQNNEKSYYRKLYDIATGHISFKDMTWMNDSTFLFINNQTLWQFDFISAKADIIMSNVDFFSVDLEKNELYVGTNGKLNLYFYHQQPELFQSLNVGAGITDLDWYEDQKIAISFIDGSVKLWSQQSGSMICQLFALNKTSLIALDSEGYYMAINEGLRGVGYRVDEQVFPPEQFDLKFNRPDIILNHLGYTDSNLINAYHEAYLKRLKKMGFSESMLNTDLHLPEIKIANYSAIPLISDESFVKLDLKIIDTKYTLDRINVWVNNVAIFGTHGINIKEQNVLNYQTTVEVPLALGTNKIQVSTLNQVGVESYKETVEIESTNGKTTPNLYIVTLGVSKYKDSRYNLTYAAKDATDMASIFEKNNTFDAVYSKTLTNEQVTLENLNEIKLFLALADINDQVIIFVAGHGVLDVNFDYYFASYDMEFSSPALRGIPYEMIEALLDGIKPLKKLLFMDTCHSGEVDKDEVKISEKTIDSGSDIVFRNVGVTIENKENQLGLQNTSELMKSVFTDLRRGTGTTVISSAGGVEFAMESELWNNGLFTYCLLNGLTTMKADLDKNKEISVSELQSYVQTEVSKLSKGKQKPTSRIENRSLDYRVW